MPKFLVYATEKIYYTKVVEAPDKATIRDMFKKGEFSFENKDIVDGEDFYFEEDDDQIEELDDNQIAILEE
jgi:hypothetical protein